MRRGVALSGPAGAVSLLLLAGWLLWAGICRNCRVRAMTPVEIREYAARNDAAVLAAALGTADEPRHVAKARGGVSRVVLDRPGSARMLVEDFFDRSVRCPRDPLMEAIASRVGESKMPRFQVDAGVRFVTPPEMERWQDEHARSMPIREPVREWGVWTFALPGYSADGRFALVYYEIWEERGCGEGHLVRLRKSLGRWRVTKNEGIWIT